MIDYKLLQSKIVIICGPTACGKSKFALDIAQKIDGVIINADSMQIYEEIPILTAQPSEADISSIPHKLYGFIECKEHFSVGCWLKLVLAEIENCITKGKIPMLVGGTGMYIYSLIEGIAEIPSISKETQDKVKDLVKPLDSKGIYDLLLQCDPVIANQVKLNDKQRIIRALEVYYQTEKPLSYWQENQIRSHNRDEFYVIYIKPERRQLYDMINARFLKMIDCGVIKEIERLLVKNIKQTEIPKALGMEQLINYIKNEITLEEAIIKAQQLTRNYAKRQMTWFNNKIKADFIINTLALYLN